MKNIKILGLMTLAISSSSITNASAQNHLYIGGDIGIATPLVNEFTYDSKTGGSLKAVVANSFFYNGRIGYSFYPKMSVEVAGSYHPTHSLSYSFPKINGSGGLTNVSSVNIMANIVYDIAKLKRDIVPFVIMGSGVSMVTVDASDGFADNITRTIKIFSNEETKGNYFTWNVGLGLAKEITDNFSMNIAGKIHIIHGVKINYSSIDASTGLLTKRDPIEKTIGFGEVSLGFKYKLPF